jgi:hypothetical protein
MTPVVFLPWNGASLVEARRGCEYDQYPRVLLSEDDGEIMGLVWWNPTNKAAWLKPMNSARNKQ